MINVTDLALDKIKDLIYSRGKDTIGIRLGTKTKGCNGLSYFMEYATEITPLDFVFEKEGIKIIIDPKAQMFIIGTIVDYEDGKFESGFKFSNPNSKGSCGCGESFNV